MSPGELSEEIILDHHKRPRNFRTIEPCDCLAEGTNPSCGDEVKVYLLLQSGKLADVAFQGQGCAISRASASLMTLKTKGKTEAEAREFSSAFRDFLSRPEGQAAAGFGDLAALAGVRQFPARIKCALLPWRTLEAALDGRATATSE